MPFPDSPYLGQLHIQRGHLWRYNGLTWSSVRIGLSDLPPAATEPSPSLTLADLEARITALEQALEKGFLLID